MLQAGCLSFFFFLSPTDTKGDNLRIVGLESSTGEREHRPMLRQLPSAHTSLHDLVRGRRLVDHVGDPGVPVGEI